MSEGPGEHRRRQRRGWKADSGPVASRGQETLSLSAAAQNTVPVPTTSPSSGLPGLTSSQHQGSRLHVRIRTRQSEYAAIRE